jgi:hypothetical protein
MMQLCAIDRTYTQAYLVGSRQLLHVTPFWLTRRRDLAMLDVREWYKPAEGELAPTKKGVRIDLAALRCIKEHLPAIAGACMSPSRSPASTSLPGVPLGKEQDNKLGPAAPPPAEQPREGEFVELGARKRMRATVFKGSKFVDLREFYEVRAPILPATTLLLSAPGAGADA